MKVTRITMAECISEEALEKAVEDESVRSSVYE